MHERCKIENNLRKIAEKLSKEYENAPVIITIGGTDKKCLIRNMTGSSLHFNYRLRDLIGILQTTIQIETIKHFDKCAFWIKEDE